MSYRRVQKESDELLCTVRSLVTVRNQLQAQLVNLFNVENFLPQNCNISSVLNIFIYITQENYYFLIISIYLEWYHTDEFRKKVYGSVIRYGPQSVTSASG